MPVTIHQISTDNRHVTLRVEIAEKADGPLLHALFQNVVNERLDLRLTLLPAPDAPDFVPFSFPLGTPFELTYDAIAQQVSMAKGPLCGAEPKWPAGPLPNYFDLAFAHRPHR